MRNKECYDSLKCNENLSANVNRMFEELKRHMDCLDIFANCLRYCRKSRKLQFAKWKLIEQLREKSRQQAERDLSCDEQLLDDDIAQLEQDLHESVADWTFSEVLKNANSPYSGLFVLNYYELRDYYELAPDHAAAYNLGDCYQYFYLLVLPKCEKLAKQLEEESGLQWAVDIARNYGRTYCDGQGEPIDVHILFSKETDKCNWLEETRRRSKSEFEEWEEKYECREKEFERRLRAYETARQMLNLLVDLRNSEQSKSSLFSELPWWDEGSPVPLEN